MSGLVSICTDVVEMGEGMRGGTDGISGGMGAVGELTTVGVPAVGCGDKVSTVDAVSAGEGVEPAGTEVVAATCAPGFSCPLFWGEGGL